MNADRRKNPASACRGPERLSPIPESASVAAPCSHPATAGSSPHLVIPKPGQVWKDATGLLFILLDSFDFGSRWKAATTFGAPESGYVQPICRMVGEDEVRAMEFLGTIEGIETPK